jgi:IclR family pca regulon transcriptional regulator
MARTEGGSASEQVAAAERDPNLIAGFAKGLLVIEAFGQNDRQEPRLSIAEVAKRTGLERASVRRCLLTLVKLGYAEHDGKFFSLTPRLLRLGHAYLSSTPLPGIVQPFLDQLSEWTEESCSVSILDGTEIVYVARAAQRRVMSIGLSVGSRLPAYCSSMGRVLLAALPREEARKLIEATDRRPFTDRTRTRVPDLMAELDRVRVQGYAIIDEELEVGLRSIAVPVRDTRGQVIAAMNIGAQSGRATPTLMVQRFLPQMLRIQAELGRLLG